MCGATSQQTNLQSETGTFANMTQQQAASRFAGQNATIGQLNGILQNVQNGKLLPGFDAATMAALSTGALDATAANYRNTLQAVQGQNAGRGGSAGTTSGILTQEQEATANAAAGQLSTEQLNIQLANEKQAEQNTATAIGGYNAVAGIENPLGFTNATTASFGAAQNAADAVAQANSQEMADIGSFVGAGVGAISGTSTFKNL